MEAIVVEEVNFSEFSSQIYKNYKTFARNLKELCIIKSVIKPTQFFENLHKEIQDLDSATTSSKELGTVAEYGELFKILDEYPSNLQKIPKKKELQRTNSTILKGCDSMSEQLNVNTSATSASLGMSSLDNEPTASKTYIDFKQFQQKMSQIYDEAAAVDKAQTAYLSKIVELQTFAQQLEKLMPVENEPIDAFTANEEAKLVAIAESLSQLNYLRSHSLQIDDPLDIASGGNATARLESLVDVLTYTLTQISCYNT